MLNKITLQGMAGASTHSSFLRDGHALPLSSFFVFEKSIYLFFLWACMLCYVMLLRISKFVVDVFFKGMAYKMYVIFQNLPNSLLMTYKHNIQHTNYNIQNVCYGG